MAKKVKTTEEINIGIKEIIWLSTIILFVFLLIYLSDLRDAALYYKSQYELCNRTCIDSCIKWVVK